MLEIEKHVEIANEILKEKDIKGKVIFCRMFGSHGNNLQLETSFWGLETPNSYSPKEKINVIILL